MNNPKIIISSFKSLQYGGFQYLDHFVGRKLGTKITKNSRKRFYKKLITSFEKKPDSTHYQVDRVKEISLNNFNKHYVKKGRPLIIEGGAKKWECVKKWSLDYFKDLHGDDEIILVDQHKMDLSHQTVTLREVINSIQEGLGKYYRFYPLLDRHPEHMADFDVKWLRQFKNVYSPTESFQVFIGGDKSYTPLHNSSLGNLFIQVVGQKQWKLYPPEMTAIIDPDPVRNIYRHAPIRKNNDSFNAFKPDFERPYELYKKMDGFEMTLSPGDIFYNPPYYWHTVQNIGDSIGVGYRWLPLLQNTLKHPLYNFLDLTARKPNFFKTMKYLGQDVNLLHLAENNQLKSYLKQKKNDSNE